jgi:MFS family permease
MTSIFPPLSFLKTQWTFLLFGFLLAFFSSPGQTFFISLFSGHIRDELGLSHGEFGNIYAAGTLVSAVCLIPAGRLVDVMRLRHIALLIIIGLGAAVLFFSTITSVMTLAVGVFLLRFTGQGMMTHLYSTAMTRRYVAERGRALAVAVLGHPVSEFSMPVFALLMLAMMEWQQVWMITGLIAWAIMIPAAIIFTRRIRGQDGEGLEGTNTAGRDGLHWTRREMLMHWRFWMLCGIVIAPAFTATGMLFHQIHFAEIKSIPLPQWISGYVFYAVMNIIGSFIGGALIDRFSASRIAPLVVANLAAVPLMLFFAAPGVMVFAFFIVFGLTQGMVYTSSAPLFAEIYGTRHLGGIKAIAQALMVFASALSPALLGYMIDAGAGLTALLVVLGSIPLISGIMGFIAIQARN